MPVRMLGDSCIPVIVTTGSKGTFYAARRMDPW